MTVRLRLFGALALGAVLLQTGCIATAVASAVDRYPQPEGDPYVKLGQLTLGKFTRAWNRIPCNPPKTYDKIEFRVFRYALDVEGFRLKREGYKIETPKMPYTIRKGGSFTLTIPKSDAPLLWVEFRGASSESNVVLQILGLPRKSPKAAKGDTDSDSDTDTDTPRDSE